MIAVHAYLHACSHNMWRYKFLFYLGLYLLLLLLLSSLWQYLIKKHDCTILMSLLQFKYSLHLITEDQ